MTDHSDAEILAAMVGEAEPSTGPVVLVDSDPRWPVDFDREAKQLRSLLPPELIVAIHHVGSTSVAGLPAKPIIDVVLVVADSADESSYVPALEDAGYTLRIREVNWHQHRLLSGPADGVRINLHVFSDDSSEVRRMLRFRDRLREDEADREIYAKTKMELAAREWRFVQNYADAKSEVVEDILGRTLDGGAY